MAGSIGNQNATLTEAYNMLNRVEGLMNTQGGGGTAPATGATPGAAPAGTPGAAAPAGTPGAAAPAAGATNSVVGTYTSNNGRQVTVNQNEGKRYLAQATGTVEIVSIDGKNVRFGPDGKETTAFRLTDSIQFKLDLDHREGLASGLANLSKVFGARQERVRMLSNALADDANETGIFDAADVQKMSLETSTTQQLSEMQKKIFDSMRDSIQAWLR